MASPYLIDLSGYAPFEHKVSFAVIEDPTLKLNPILRSALAPGQNFTFRPDHALYCAIRHLYVDPNNPPANHPKLALDWLNVLRWELMTFWQCDPINNLVHDTAATKLFSAEHPRRIGELFAEGLAILLLERRLRINRNRFYFYSDDGARPDFVVNGMVRAPSGFITPSNHRLGLETRCRKGWSSIRASDFQSLANKKGTALVKTVSAKGGAVVRTYQATGSGSGSGSSFDIILAVYFSHSDTNCQVILGDPGDFGVPLSQIEILQVVVAHYAQQAARIGLWSHYKIIDELRKEIAADRLPDERADPSAFADAHLNHESFAGKVFVGRFFSNFLEAVQGGSYTATAAGEILERRSYDFFFFGIDVYVLMLLRTCRWRELLAYFAEDPAWASEGTSHAQQDALHSDGVLFKHSVSSDDADFIHAAMKNMVDVALAERARQQSGPSGRNG